MCVTFLSIAVEDYTETSGTLIFTNTTLTQCVYVGVVNDNISESSNECFTVGLSSGTETVDIPSVATVCIADNDGQLFPMQLMICILFYTFSFAIFIMNSCRNSP